MISNTATSFTLMLSLAIDETGITKEAIAAEMGVNLTTVYRTLAGKGITKSKVLATVRAINKLAMFEAINANDALKAEGFQPEPRADDEIDHVLIASVIDMLATMPHAIQEDVLAIVKALHNKHAA